MYSATNRYISFLATKDIETESLLQYSSALYKDFVKYYALLQYSRIKELLIVYSIVNM